jgi:hypothetical protein
MIPMLVNRLHVGSSDREVIRYIRSKLSDKGRSPEAREQRREFYREALAKHHENREDYLRWGFR